MRVVVVSLFSFTPNHLATELEILQRHIDDGDQIEVLACNGYLPACMCKTDGRMSVCRACVTDRYLGLKKLKEMPPIHVLEDYYYKEDRAKEKELKTAFDSGADIREYNVGALDIGYGGLSSTVWQFRDPFVQSEKSKVLLAKMIVASYRTYCSVGRFFQQFPGFDRAYVFNGRFATTRGAYRACEAAGVDVFLHERGSNNNRYMLYENGLPHDKAKMDKRINDLWEGASPEERKVGSEFYENRRERVESFWWSFTKSQQKGKLPESFETSARNVAVFTSSDDEFVSIGKGWEMEGFESQAQAIDSLQAALAEEQSDIQLYVRMHPNLKGVDNQDTRRLHSLSGPNLHLLPPESDICSYGLLDSCEKVLTFGSTMGAEATYWGKPSILAGISFYRSLGGNYIANNDSELLDLAKAQLTPKPQEPALRYGLYMSTFGEPYRYYKPDNFETGRFRGWMMRGAVPLAPYRLLIPQIIKKLGKTDGLRRSVEAVSYSIGYVPFRWLYDASWPLRLVLRKARAISKQA